MTWQQIYLQTHQAYHKLKYPDAFAAGHWSIPELEKEPSAKQKEKYNTQYKRWKAVLKELDWLVRYNALHYKYTLSYAPSVIKDGHYNPPPRPNILKEKGLAKFIRNFIYWDGGNANDMRHIGGAIVDEKEKQESGVVLTVKKFKFTGTKHGIADIISTLKNGRAASWEIKIGKDRPRDSQLKEQERERRSGIYEFVYSVEEFLEFYDKYSK